MASSDKRKTAGGVAGAELRFAGDWGSASFSDNGSRCSADFRAAPCRVPLVEFRSHFDERTACEGGPVCVEHTLTLVADRRDAAPWLDRDFVRRCAYEGVVAQVTLNDGRTLLAGCSEHLRSEQPLKLVSLQVLSGVLPSDRPVAVLTLRSVDTAAAAEMVQ